MLPKPKKLAIIDYTLTNPTKQGTLQNAALVPLFCANAEHNVKNDSYDLQHMPRH